MHGKLFMKQKIRSYVSTWESRGYKTGIPDAADDALEKLNKAPSYRAICKAIMRNDVALTSLGFPKQYSDAYMSIKKEEINERLRKREAKNKESV